MPPARPLFKWAGSKQRMLAAYQPVFFPPGPIRRFVDLFAGGLAVALWVADQHPDADLVINDRNPELALLYRTLARQEAAVTAAWDRCVQQWLPLGPDARKAQYYQWRHEYCLAHAGLPDAHLSGLLLFMLQVNFNGLWKAYAKCAGRYSTPPGTCRQRASSFDRPRIAQVAAVLRRAEITSVDFQDVPVRAGDFVYADPPYRDSVVDYQGGFAEADQVRLARFLTAHDGPYAYSNKDIGDGFYARHFPGATAHPMAARYTAGRGTSVIDASEVLLTRWPVSR